jgi:hypothetical protein
VALALLASLLGFVTASASGETWSALGDGVGGDVYALAFDSNGNLYAGGSFTTAGGVTANRIAKWDGSVWSPLGSGMNNTVSALAFDSSGNLYAGGSFTSAGGVTANRIAKWNGTSWTALGGGLSGSSTEVDALAFDRYGNLYAGGNFPGPVARIAKWDGSSWSALGIGMGGGVNALIFDGSGNLYAGGSFTSPANHIAKWDGSAWSSLSSGTSNTVRTLTIDGSGNLYVGGDFGTAGGVAAKRIAKWDGSTWTSLSSGMNSGGVYTLALDNDGNLYAGGSFVSTNGATVNYIAKWYETSWSALSSGMDDVVQNLALDNNGRLYAGGTFTSASGVAANRIAKWAIPLPGIVPSTSSTLFCTGENATVTISLSDVVDLFGYQFIVHYNPGLVNASAVFMDTFFDTRSDASIPTEWNASCGAGECKFAVSKVEPGAPVSGSGPVAQIALTGLNAGVFDLTISDDILTDRDAQAVEHELASLPLTVCGYANVSGMVSLQGRATPVDTGQVTLTDLGGIFGPYITNINSATGAFTINNIKVMPGGSNYQLDAAHGLYLGNRTISMLHPLDSFAAPVTRLLGGDANNDGLIDLSDLTCIGGSFGGAPVTCGTTGSNDINADGIVNILDLVLPGSNYGLSAPRSW